MTGRKLANRLWEAFRERLALSGLAYPVPKYARNLLFHLGGMLAILLLLQSGVGILFATYYHPASDAYHSLWFIVNKIPFGGFIRSLHYWLSNLIVILLLLHLGKNYLIAAYRRPREAQWVIGILLGATVALFVVSGIVLRADQEGYNTLQSNSRLLEALTGFDFLLSQGGFARIPTISRIFILHAGILPLTALALVLVHVYLVKQFGLAVPFWVRTSRPDTIPFTSHIRKTLTFAALLGLVAIALSAAFPAPLLDIPRQGIRVKPSWILLWASSVEAILGQSALFYSWIIILAALAAVPFIDRGPTSDPKPRKHMIVILGISVAIWVALSIYGLVA